VLLPCHYLLFTRFECCLAPARSKYLFLAPCHFYIMFSCRWKSCRREYPTRLELISHVEEHIYESSPLRLCDVPLLKRAQGFSSGKYTRFQSR